MERFEYDKSVNNSLSFCDTSTIGGRITYYRLENNMTQQELADATNLHRTTIIAYEKNKLDHLLKNINLISSYLSIDPCYLYDDYLAFIAGDYGKQIKDIRKQMNLTQKQFCKLLNFNDTVGKWETEVSTPSRDNYQILEKYIKK